MNFTGVPLVPPICVTKGNDTKNSTCLQLFNVTTRFDGNVFNNMAPPPYTVVFFQFYKVTYMGVLGSQCVNDMPIRRPNNSKPCYHVTPISKSLRYPPWLSYHTSERHCVVLQKNFTLQSWNNYTREKNNHTWAFGGFPFPQWVSLHDRGVENQLWKVWAALGPINITNFQGTVHYNMTMRTCLTGNHAFMWGRAQNVNIMSMHSGEYNVTCINCRVSECIGTKIRDQIIFVITQQKFALVPVKSKDCYESHSDRIFGIIDQSNQLAVARKKRCISCVVLGIVSLIAIITASVSLSQSVSIARNEIVQADFMSQLARNVSKGFQTQEDR
uniref:Uncharacterized protein LOC110214804 n=1 Tax=Phascolarctos cinereus TaxID=38626 RepID=A0A6P5L1G1_PHACI|nr:uncharacterized protein LOC110214804 [Phascolarctos cinereus]XP_020851548.1 uncharacterized protein LOC110214804 [Phascolarctos cinereus]